MARSMTMSHPSRTAPSIRHIAAAARRSAVREIGDASLVSIQLSLTRTGQPCGYVSLFASEHRSWMGKVQVRQCSVSSQLDGTVVATNVQPPSNLSRHGLAATGAALAAIPIDALRVEVADLLLRLAEDLVIPWPVRRDAERQLVLTASRAGRPEWQAQYYVRGVGYAGVFIEAGSGLVAFEQLHVDHEAGVAPRDLGNSWEAVINALPIARQLASAAQVPADMQLGPLATCRICRDVLVQTRQPGHPTRLAVVPRPVDAVAFTIARSVFLSRGEFFKRFIERCEHLSVDGPPRS